MPLQDALDLYKQLSLEQIVHALFNTPLPKLWALYHATTDFWTPYFLSEAVLCTVTPKALSHEK